MMVRPHRSHPLWLAYAIHRFSGVLLALFLPVHFYVLSLTVADRPALDGFLKWTDQPLVRIAESGLVLLLSVHLFGGIRLLALEFLPWSNRQKAFVGAAIAAAFLVGGLYLLRAV